MQSPPPRLPRPGRVVLPGRLLSPGSVLPPRGGQHPGTLLSRHARFLTVLSEDFTTCASYISAGHDGSDTGERAGARRLRGPCPREGSQSEHCLLP